ncbi:MAG: PAS domain S-box protein [Anaeromyxobacteraceae bacterium]
MKKARSKSTAARSPAGARDQVARLRAVFDSPAIGVALTGPDKRWVEVNDPVCEMLGYSRDELVRTTWGELTHPDDLAGDVAQFDLLLAGGISRYSMDKRFIRKDGSVLWTLLSVNCVRRPAGKVQFVVAILIDIGQRKKAEEALRDSEARMARVLGGSADGFGDYEAATGRVTITPRYCEIYDLPAGTREVSVETLLERVEPADLPPILADMEFIGAGWKDSHVWEYRIRREDGAARWIQSRGKVVGRDVTGRPVHVSGAITDITARKLIEEERERVLEELRGAAGQEKLPSDFVPICSSCKRTRDAQGTWEGIEAFVARRTDVRFSHGICPTCAKRLFPER